MVNVQNIFQKILTRKHHLTKIALLLIEEEIQKRLYERPNAYLVDNRHVVPYCPRLTLMFNCHINVEVVSSIESVKYLYKYIYKGHGICSSNNRYV